MELFPHRPPLPDTPDPVDEDFWTAVRQQFLIPPDLAVMNAANLCPASLAVLRAVWDATLDIERDPSPINRVKMIEGRESARRILAEFLRVSPEEILITRNTSEANNLVSNGLQLGPGDEVLIHADNHSSNYAAWLEKARRVGFTVTVVEQVNPHPGPEYYLEVFAARMTGRTRILAFNHVSGQTGDLFPARELCRMARERGVATLVDAAQSFGVLDLDLGDMQPDFCTASAHKWACGPKEVGLLYINKSVQSQVWPTLISSRPGAVGIARTLEAFGQRNEPAMIGFAEALRLQTRIGRKAIETRSRQFARTLIEGFRCIDGVTVWTHPDPARSAAITTIRPGNLDPAELVAALYHRDKIVCAARTGPDRPGLRFSPHFYNLPSDIERAVAAVERHLLRA